MNYNISRLNLFKNIKGKNRKLVTLLIITVAIPLTVYLTIKGIEYLTRGAATTVNVSFSQSSLTLNPNATNPTNINVLTNASTSQVGFARVEFTFDATKLMLTSEIIPTTVFKKVIKKSTMAEANSSGRVTLVLGLDPADKANPPTGVVQLATISLKAKPGSSGSTSLTFDNSKMQIIDMTAVADTLTSTNTSVTITSATTPPSTATATPTTAPTATATPTTAPTATATVAATATATATSVATATPTTPASSQMTFSFKLQGITTQRPNTTVKVTVRNLNSSVVVSQFDTVTATSNSSGIYSGTVTGIPAGTYDIFIKEPAFLQQKFASVSLINGANTKDFTANALRGGDFNNNNSINLSDMSLILSQYTALTVPVNSGNAIYDINKDTIINLSDVSLALSNYTALTVPGDN